MDRTARFLDPSGVVRTGAYREDGVNSAGRQFNFDEIDLLAPCVPSKIICIGLNYADHAEEEGMEIPDRPLLFLKTPNTVSGPNDTITLPAGKDRVDYEAEMGVVIKRQCRNVPASEAMEVVEGYTCVNDVSNRDDQRVEQNWVRGKSFDNAAPLGPAVASPDRLPSDARIASRVNGELRQESSLEQLIFSVEELIEEITRYMTLEPGDVISTGTPAGVGPLSEGDRVEIELEGVGVLENHVREESG